MASKAGRRARFAAACSRVMSSQPKPAHKHKTRGSDTFDGYRTPVHVTQKRAMPTDAQLAAMVTRPTPWGQAKVQTHTAAGYQFSHTGENRTNKTTVANTRQIGDTFTVKTRRG